MSSLADPFSRAAALETEADCVAGRGDIVSARGLRELAAEIALNRGEAWLEPAAMCRAVGDLPAALTAVSGALRVDPLGFLPLLLKASLLDAHIAESADRLVMAATDPSEPMEGL